MANPRTFAVEQKKINQGYNFLFQGQISTAINHFNDIIKKNGSSAESVGKFH